MFRTETEVDTGRQELLRTRLRDTNTERSPELRAMRGTQHVPLHVWSVEEPSGGLAAGLTGTTWAGWLHVELLWVDARHRGRRLGAHLLAEAERLAREERRCHFARLETWSFQAPDFYRKQGYEVVAAIPDYPPGVTEFTLTKRLVA